jgi:adenosylcobyric acid synthase
MGHTQLVDRIGDPDLQPLVKIQYQNQSNYISEGWRSPRKVWGTYLHGLFESSLVRQELVQMADISGYRVSELNWQTQQQQLYNQMADLLETHLDLNPIRRYLDL